MIDLALLEALVAVADELHFGRAARRLHMTQPPLSKRVQRAETELGIRVFLRDRRGVRVTEEGEVILTQARQVLASSRTLVESAAGLGQGTVGRVRIAAVGSAFFAALPGLLGPVRARSPDIDLVIAELETPAAVRALRQGRVDLAFLRPPVSADLTATTVWTEPLVAAVHESHPRAGDGTIALTELVRQRIVLFRRDRGPGYWDRVNELFMRLGTALEPVVDADHVTTLLGMVAVDLGVSVVPASARALAVPGVRYLDIAPTTSLPLAVVTSAGRPRPTVARVLSHIPAVRHPDPGADTGPHEPIGHRDPSPAPLPPP